MSAPIPPDQDLDALLYAAVVADACVAAGVELVLSETFPLALSARPASRVTPEIAAAIRAHKQALITLLYEERERTGSDWWRRTEPPAERLAADLARCTTEMLPPR